MAGTLRSNIFSRHFINSVSTTFRNKFKNYVAYSTTVVGQQNDDSKFWVTSKYPPVERITDRTVPEVLWENLDKWPDAPAYTCAFSGRSYTHGQVYQYSGHFATALQNSGFKRGDVATIFLPNIPEFPIVINGIWQAGLTPSPLNPTYTKHEVVKCLSLVEPKVLITIPMFLPVIREAMKELPSLKSIIIIGENQEGCHSFQEMLMSTLPNPDNFLKGHKIDTTKEIALLPFSSGTTGPPKVVEMSHSSLSTSIKMFLRPEIVTCKPFHSGNPQEKIIGILPFFHASGCNVVMFSGIQFGVHTITVPKFEPKSFAEILNKHKFNLMHFVTPLLNFVINSPDVKQEAFENLHTFAMGATPIGKNTIEGILKKAGGKEIFAQEGYGMTEVSLTHLVHPSYKASKIGSCGEPIPGVTCKIVDIETGKCLGPDQKGELCIKGPLLMTGYYKNPKATAETIIDGWLHTGDVAYYDKDNCFYIIDRLKELIKVKGHQVSPSELEDVLRLHQKISDVGVIGVPSEKEGEVPRAYIVKSNESLTEDEIHKYLNELLSSFKQLKGGIEFVPAIPKTAAGKILRKDLKAEYLKNHSK